MGLIMRSGNSYGGGLTRLFDMLDVNISNPSDGQVPMYNSETQKWENGSIESNIDDTMTSSSKTWSSNKVNTELGNMYKTTDTAETTLSDDDTFPFYDDSASTKKKSTWSNIVAKIKSAIGIESSGSTFLKKDGTWGTPTNTTYAAGTGVTISGTNNAINVTYGSAANTACQGNDSRLSDARTPTSHASTGTGYGVGNASNYGHVKLSDTYTSNVGAAANSIGASQSALYGVYARTVPSSAKTIGIYNNITKTDEVFIYKTGRLCSIVGRFVVNTAFTPSGWYKIATVSSDCKPITYYYFYAFTDSTSFAQKYLMSIDPNGDITMLGDGVTAIPVNCRIWFQNFVYVSAS